MNEDIAFVGDIHGNLGALRGVTEVLRQIDPRHVVFLGDFINKGKNSFEVMEFLLSISTSPRVTLLRGNHEALLLEAIETQDVRHFLKIGGAATIKSYLKRPVKSNVLQDFLVQVPEEHLQMLHKMPTVYREEGLVARHIPQLSTANTFEISAHLPVGTLPLISETSASIDTEADKTNGRLTVFRWPSKQYFQVSANGEPIEEHSGRSIV